MPESYGSSFPSVGIQQGLRHVSTDGLIYRYLGGDPSNIDNWLVDGGSRSTDPDTSEWDSRKTGATWYNTTEKQQKYWTGSHVRSISVNVSVVTAETLTIDTGTSSHFRVLLNQNITTMNLTGERDGQKVIIEAQQDATGSRTIAWPSNVRFSTDLTEEVFIPSASAGEKTYFGLIYNGADGVFDAVAIIKGFP